MATKYCPRCYTGQFTPYEDNIIPGESPPFPALSRRDNKTYICSNCGQLEAFEDMGWKPPWRGHRYWEEEDEAC